MKRASTYVWLVAALVSSANLFLSRAESPEYRDLGSCDGTPA